MDRTRQEKVRGPRPAALENKYFIFIRIQTINNP